MDDDCRLRYAAGAYWIQRCNKTKQYLPPVITNETGSCIWQCLKGGMDIESTVKYISGLYKIPEEEAYKDVADFSKVLQLNGCLKN